MAPAELKKKAKEIREDAEAILRESPLFPGLTEEDIKSLKRIVCSYDSHIRKSALHLAAA